MLLGGRRRAVASSMVAFGVVALLVGGLVAVIDITKESTLPQTTTTTQSSVTAGTTSTSKTSPTGLVLALGVRSAAISEGDPIQLTFKLTNSLSSTVNLEPGSGEFSAGPCTQLPYGIEIARGYYTSENLSAATGLGLFWPGVYFCPAEFAVDYWSFAPGTDQVSLYSLQPVGQGNQTVPTSMWSQSDKYSVSFWGGWSGGALGVPSPTAKFSSFGQGIYTAAAGDDWGDVVVLHFKVVPSTSLLSCSTVASSGEYFALGNSTSGPGPLRMEAAYRQAGSNGTFLVAITPKGETSFVSDEVDYNVYGVIQFSPDPSATQSWQFYPQGGANSYPATFSAGECSLLRIYLQMPTGSFAFIIVLSDGTKQTFLLQY